MTTATSDPISIRVIEPRVDDRPAWVTALPLMTWAQIPNTRMDSILAPDPRGFSPKTALAQCGAALREANSEMWLMTGGHADGCSNAVYSISLESETPAWVMRRGPTPTEQIQTDVHHYLDGRPTSTHTGWTVQYNQQRDLFMRFGVTAAYGSGGYNAKSLDAFDPVTNDWLPAGTFSDCPITPNMDRCTAKVGEDVFQQGESGSANIVRWQNSAGPYGAWDTVGYGSVFEKGPALIHDPIRNRLVRFDRYRPTFLPLDNPASIVPVKGPDYTGVQATTKIITCPHEYVPAIGSAYDGHCLWIENGYTLYNDPTRTQEMFVYMANLDTFENTLVPVAGTAPRLSTGMVGILFRRFMIIEKLKLLVVINRENEDIYCVRLA